MSWPQVSAVDGTLGTEPLVHNIARPLGVLLVCIQDLRK